MDIFLQSEKYKKTFKEYQQEYSNTLFRHFCILNIIVIIVNIV